MSEWLEVKLQLTVETAIETYIIKMLDYHCHCSWSRKTAILKYFCFFPSVHCEKRDISNRDQ